MAKNAIAGTMVIIDGTGPVDDFTYWREFQESFCRQIQSRTGQVEYLRGVPGEQSTNLINIVKTLAVSVDNQVRGKAEAGMEQIQRAIAPFGSAGSPTGFKIFIAAHSRGGASAVILAQMLKARKIPVEAMFLFDAVNMTLSERDVAKVPDNVRACYHAIRDPGLAMQILGELNIARRRRNDLLRQAQFGTNPLMPKMQPGMAPLGYVPSMGAPTVLQQQLAQLSPALRGQYKELERTIIRLEDMLDKTRSNPESLVFNWGNCATSVADPELTKTFEMQKFWGSHGALGGCPWGSEVFPLDMACTSSVWKWMQAFLDAHNVFDIQRFEKFQQLLRTA